MMIAGNGEFANFNLPNQSSQEYLPRRCAIHSLHLPIKVAFKGLAPQLIKARSISSLVRTSPKFDQILKRECEQLEVEKSLENMDAYRGPVKLKTGFETGGTQN